MEHEQEGPGDQSPWRFDSRWILIGFLAVGAFFLFTEHRAHLLGFLPYAILLACPLMHMLHGHGHGSHGHEDDRPAPHQHGEKKS